MLVLYIFILMFTNSINHIKKNIHSTFINRISIITILLSIFLVINVLNFQSIGKGISIYSGLFQITIQSQIIEVLLLIVGICILISWPVSTATPQNDFNNNSRLSPVDPKGEFTLTNIRGAGVESTFYFETREQYSLVAIFSIIGVPY